jgi:hypothetical protein
MLGHSQLMKVYDEWMERFDEPPISFALFDNRVLVPRSMVPEWVERETAEVVSLERLNDMEAAHLFTWRGGAGDDGTEVGVPLYVPGRIGLLASLERKGWTPIELQDYAEMENAIVEDCIEQDNFYDENDAVIVARQARADLANVNSEIWGRLPVDAQPAGWHRRSSSSILAALTTEELTAKRKAIEAFVDRVESTVLATAEPRWRRQLARAAFGLRSRGETVLALLVCGDRAEMRAGYSSAIWLSGAETLVPDSTDPAAFGRIDWKHTLHHWRFLNDPDRYPLRVPGFVLIGGKITLDGLPTPEDYEKAHRLFNLAEYLRLYKEVAGDRRCAHCTGLLKVSAGPRCRYCSPRCGRASRQKLHRQRKKAQILRSRSAGQRAGAD